MAEIVFDTEPLITFLYREPGHEAIATYLQEVESGATEGSMAEVTASEVFSVIARLEGDDGVPTADSIRAADRDVRTLERRGVTLRRADWRLAGEIKADGGLSLGDAYCAALAYERIATLVVGSDDEFDDLPIDVPVEPITTKSG